MQKQSIPDVQGLAEDLNSQPSKINRLYRWSTAHTPALADISIIALLVMASRSNQRGQA